MDTNLKTKSRTDVAEQFGDMVEKGATQSKEALEKMSAATGQAADVMKGEGFTMTKPEQFWEMVEKGATQSKEALEKMSAATGQAADVMKGEGFTMTKPNRLTLGTPPQAVA